MREALLDILQCPVCEKNSFILKEASEDHIEIKEGVILCNSCNSLYGIESGIVDFLKYPETDIKREQKAMEDEEYIRDDKGGRFKINKDSIERFKKQFLLLPEGDGSYFFKKGGCFQSIAEASSRFYNTFKQMGLKGNEKVLSLGDGFTYASYKFAKSGCSAVALDISKYLIVSELYIKDVYFERIFGDMHVLPFRDNVFDIVFCAAVLHHSKNLKKVFSEIHRVLKSDGRAFIINECARGIFEKINPLFNGLQNRGYSDSAFTIPQWLSAAGSSSFRNIKIEFLSLVDDYIIKQENKNVDVTNLLRLAYFFRRHPVFERPFLFLLKYPRILFRPRSWRIVCCK